jgi:SAM-dependent methyltransferase
MLQKMEPRNARDSQGQVSKSEGTGHEALTATEALIIPDASQWERAWTDGTSPEPEVHWQMIHAIAQCMEIRGKSILEIGAGTGCDSAMLASLGATAYALDLTQIALELTREAAEKQKSSVHLIAGDTLRLPFHSGTFDLVFSQGLLEHFSEPEAVVREQARITQTGGYLLVDVPQRYSLYTLHKRRLMRRGEWFAGWETEFSLSELSDLLKAEGLEPVASYGYGYFPALLSGIRNIHTIDQRRFQGIRFPRAIGNGIERSWSKIEKSRLYYRWLSNVGVIARKA